MTSSSGLKVCLWRVNYSAFVPTVPARRQAARLARERRTIHAMIALYCRDHHGTSAACADCSALAAYADLRLDRCVYGAAKPTCANCPIHCYKPAMREQIRAVMRYAGPRMLRRHPVLAVAHVLGGRRPAPSPRRRARATKKSDDASGQADQLI